MQTVTFEYVIRTREHQRIDFDTALKDKIDGFISVAQNEAGSRLMMTVERPSDQSGREISQELLKEISRVEKLDSIKEVRWSREV